MGILGLWMRGFEREKGLDRVRGSQNVFSVEQYIFICEHSLQQRVTRCSGRSPRGRQIRIFAAARVRFTVASSLWIPCNFEPLL